MDGVSSQNWMEGVVDFQDSIGTTKDTAIWGCLEGNPQGDDCQMGAS